MATDINPFPNSISSLLCPLYKIFHFFVIIAPFPGHLISCVTNLYFTFIHFFHQFIHCPSPYNVPTFQVAPKSRLSSTASVDSTPWDCIEAIHNLGVLTVSFFTMTGCRSVPQTPTWRTTPPYL